MAQGVRAARPQNLRMRQTILDLPGTPASTEIRIDAPYIRSLVWDGDSLVDWLASAGWMWHPVDDVALYGIEAALADGSTLDTVSRDLDVLTDRGNAAGFDPRSRLLVSIETGQVVAEWPGIATIIPSSAVQGERDDYTAYACDMENARIAIAHDGGITVIAFDIAPAAATRVAGRPPRSRPKAITACRAIVPAR